MTVLYRYVMSVDVFYEWGKERGFEMLKNLKPHSPFLK